MQHLFQQHCWCTIYFISLSSFHFFSCNRSLDGYFPTAQVLDTVVKVRGPAPALKLNIGSQSPSEFSWICIAGVPSSTFLLQPLGRQPSLRGASIFNSIDLHPVVVYLWEFVSLFLLAMEMLWQTLGRDVLF